MVNNAKIRLFVDAVLTKEQTVSLNAKQAHYLSSVMRMAQGQQILIFNGLDGEWLANIDVISKKTAIVSCINQTQSQKNPPDLWLLFAPIKKTRTDFIVEKATELGVSKILPVQTDFTNSGRINQDRLQSHAIEAAEQCGGTFVPTVSNLCLLDSVLNDWPDDRQLLFCDETTAGDALLRFNDKALPKWAILIGPEGGFSDRENNVLRSNEEIKTMSLGPRILRADTAAVSAITLWQASIGDWK